MSQLWQVVEDALVAGAGALAERAQRYPHWFAAAVVDRSRRYTSEREDLDRPTDRDADLAARALFFSVVDAAKILVPLAELAHSRGGLPGAADRPRRVVDLGAGCGAMSLGLLAAASAHSWGSRWEITMVDRDAAALAIARRAIEHLASERGLEVAVQLHATELSSWRSSSADLVIAGAVLNELPAAASRALLTHALAAVGRDGAVILVEPALREATRRLHALRDEHLRQGSAHVVAPCVRRGAPCPMLARPTDWCHEDRRYQPPPRVRAVADVTRLRDGNLKFAYLVLAQAPSPLLAVPEGKIALRVVSGALPGKGRRELFVCGDYGRVPIRRLDRRASEANEWFDDVRRGDLLIVDAARSAAAAAGSRIEVLEGDSIRVQRFAELTRSADLEARSETVEEGADLDRAQPHDESGA
jgi:precorrin-6B methylase 2